MHAPPTQFLQRLPAACAPLTVQQVAFHLRGAHRAPRQRARRQHRMRAPAPPALDPQNLDRPPVQVLLVAAVMPKPPAAARRTAHAVQPFGNVFDPVALLLAVDYDDRSRLRGNRVGRQPTVPGFPSSLSSGSPTAKRESQPFSTTRSRALTHGNVWEWVEDCWSDVASASYANGRCEEKMRVVRGGSWADEDVRYLRFAMRGRSREDLRTSFTGFRVAEDLEEGLAYAHYLIDRQSCSEDK